MRPFVTLEITRKKVGHLFSQVPTIKRAAVNHRESIIKTQLSTSPRSIFNTKLKQRQIDATRNYFMLDSTATQSFPFFNDRPDAFSQRYDTISCSKNAALGGLCETIRNTTFAPVFCVDILLRH